MVENNYYVYQHVDPRTHLVRYIGKGKEKRAWNLISRSGHHKNWLKQLAAEGLEPVVEIIESNKTEEQAFELEKLWIAACRSSFQPLTNRTDGGEGLSGWAPSEETKERMSEARKGKPKSEAHKKKMSQVMKGRYDRERHPQFGKQLSEETKKRMSGAQKGKTHSEETRKKISEVQIGKISPLRRPVIGKNLQTGEYLTFESATAAATFVGGHHSNVSHCCHGNRKKHKGYTFRFAENSKGVKNAK